MTLEQVLAYIPVRLGEKGIYLGNIKIIEKLICSNKASVNHFNRTIQICYEHFYGLPIEDQTSIIYHEYYHLTNDMAKDTDWNAQRKALDSSYYFPNPPDFIMDYYKDANIGSYYALPANIREGMSLEEYVLQGNFVSFILPPTYYQNEISAYEAEKTLFPLVSDEYRKEREIKLWEFQQLKLYSMNNYINL